MLSLCSHSLGQYVSKFVLLTSSTKIRAFVNYIVHTRVIRSLLWNLKIYRGCIHTNSDSTFTVIYTKVLLLGYRTRLMFTRQGNRQENEKLQRSSALTYQLSCSGAFGPTFNEWGRGALFSKFRIFIPEKHILLENTKNFVRMEGCSSPLPFSYANDHDNSFLHLDCQTSDKIKWNTSPSCPRLLLAIVYKS